MHEVNIRQQLILKVKENMGDTDVSLLEKACDYAEEYHGKQVRESGEPYFHHPIEVAYIVAEMRLDLTSVITAVLHDTIEDTKLTFDIIKQEFNEEIAKLVDGVTKLTKIEYQPDYVRQAESFRKLLLAISEDVRVLLIKLADRLHNMRTIKYVKSAEKKGRIARETMDIYAPLAERMGMQKIKLELQDLAFAELHPAVRQSIVSRLEYLHKTEGLIVDNVIKELESLFDVNSIKARVFGREKAPCSIWFKMQRKKVSFEQLSDIIAFRVIVSSIDECYKTLGVIHTNYQVVPGEFMDYISIPKDNGYKSIHTVVIGPSKQRVEIQIRTEEMHEIAEYGVAAHWLYKHGSDVKKEGKTLKWLRELLSVIENSIESRDILENAKMQMYYDQVFCFTQTGSLIVLPKGATPVDFAYAVHSEIGNTCIGAKVNGRLVPLQIQLENGDQVEIITNKGHHPTPAWENFVITAKAKSEIKKFVRNQQREQYLNLGRAIIAKEIRGRGHEYNESFFSNILDLFKKKSVEDLLVSIGEGVISRNDIIKALYPESGSLSTIKKSLSIFSFKRNRERKIEDAKKVNIVGLIPGMAVHYGGCCHPIPGDRIVGIINTGKGITIHTADCDTLENYSSFPELWIDVSWDKDQYHDQNVVRIKVVLTHATGSLATLTDTIAKEQANIINFKVISRTQDFFEILIDVEVKTSDHLNNIITSLKSKSCVHSVDRYKS